MVSKSTQFINGAEFSEVITNVAQHVLVIRGHCDVDDVPLPTEGLQVLLVLWKRELERIC